ncbi:MAG: Lrp/AsnC family transcriptional regulator [Nanoarchaeota archaeon]|nr:Lrp/AsnC family transcriptional regulator [Nanoarchaeota archaeon]
MKTSFDDKDIRILRALRTDSRKSLASIAVDIGMPHTTLMDRMQKIKRIRPRFTTLIDFERLGFSYRCIFMLRVMQRIQAEKIAMMPNINTVSFIDDEKHIMAEAVFRNILEVEEFREMLDQFHDIRHFYILEELKRESFMSGV